MHYKKMWPNGDESLVACPYNRFHVVSKLKIQKHLMKCKKNYPDVKLATCFYNFSHKLRPEDMLKHYETCSHRTRMEGSRYCDPGTYNPINSPTKNDDDDDDHQSFSFPKATTRTEKHFYNPHKYPRHALKSDFECEDDFGDVNFESDGTLLYMETNSESDAVASSDDDSDDMKPLPLPKTVSKAFTCIKQNPEKSSIDIRMETPQPRGFGRAKNILRVSPPKPPETTDHSLPNKSIIENVSSQSKIPKFSSRNVTSYSASVVSSLFDDGITLTSQDILDDDVDDDDDDDDSDDDDDDILDGVNLKSFDKYVKI